MKNQNPDLLDLEKRLIEKQDKIDKEREDLEKEKDRLKEEREEYVKKLQKASGLTADEAKASLLAEVENSQAQEIAKILKEREEEIKRISDKKAQEILLDSMRHGALNYIAEYTVSIVKIPDEEMKGRIIGKEGRNIRAFEQATGVDVDLDEEGIIRLSSFDQIRREVARRALEKLIKDTRVQPFRIEEIVKETEEEVEKIMFEEGEKLSHEAGVFNLPRELISMLGRFKFRTSYGQNLVVHTLEETKIGIHIAEEIGADVNIVRLGCLFHDIGKVVPGEGSHVKLGVEYLKRFNIPEAVVNCVAEHHEDRPFSSVESVIVSIADAISGARPGARYEDVEEYAKRLTEMEDIAKKYEGVAEAYAFEAGRELRVIIDPGKLDDAQTVVVAEKIRQEVTNALAIPGEVKVTAIREFRSVSSEFN
ncbi:MAG: ribonuclease Y [Candidatus Levybacteria bacterium RIFOXYA1_FULL_41_10]|nr:MAG: Ribonuclease Y [Candidatus Levybacteria bacterium GW2011_GWA1_39_34]KKR50714.1 MAG: Ribonuclease Y [Candidatus Levybacteria bacterium GW2011_GWC1_40_19]KKR95314.1 MAG: Ribonuclease Y [Candidatus Levybacteria bacterium GW2011_GWA2_41_15]KKS01079.1 MAG: Ribonuclease Y [Candidatus Levybacteria bacterium GW2011_GWB1_41_21]OGH21097.1 MAG: ribonuclease Y [Candidatus Levybacteria bacterium RIFCSPHIGHO2_01_FULL_40_83]OGH25331.1 MAG: ribonuclease Y [Candidatus Levybacteria bacterium RIFCSPHIGHO